MTTADAPSALEASWTWLNHSAVLQGWGVGVVDLGMPSWVGGPGKAAARLTKAQARQLANWLGYTRRVKGAPINSHGQQIFTNGRSFITLDFDMHQGPLATWKLFDRNWDRLGTYTFDLLQQIGK